MTPLNQSIIDIPDKHENYNVEMIMSLPLHNEIQFSKDDNDQNIDTVNDYNVDINSKEQDNMRDIQQYNQYQQNLQNQQLLTSSDIIVIEPDEVPDTDSITDKTECPKCGNHEAYWWIVQTDTVEEPSTQFFRCTKCKHTWRTPRSS
ncbi:MAG: zinc ribbon domain-containing protein [Candidatus Nitrosocosmicus sp.]